MTAKSALDEAFESMAEATSLTVSIRQDLVVERLLQAFQSSPLSKQDYNAIQQDINTILTDAAFNVEAFPLEGTAGIDAAWSARLRLQAARDELLRFSRALRKAVLKTNRLLRIARVYTRQLEPTGGLNMKTLEEIVLVSLREIAAVNEEAKRLKEDVSEAFEAVNEKTRTLDAWFALHKQYVFLTGLDNRARETNGHESRRLGTRRV